MWWHDSAWRAVPPSWILGPSKSGTESGTTIFLRLLWLLVVVDWKMAEGSVQKDRWRLILTWIREMSKSPKGEDSSVALTNAEQAQEGTSERYCQIWVLSCHISARCLLNEDQRSKNPEKRRLGTSFILGQKSYMQNILPFYSRVHGYSFRN